MRPLALSRPGLLFIAVTVFLDSLAQSITTPILPRLAQELLGGDLAAAARWSGWLEVAWAGPMLIAAPVLGALSDRFGRRPIIVISTLGLGAELVLQAVAPSVGWLLLGRVLTGISFGGQAAAFAYVADVTAPEERTAAFGWANAALWAGIMVGPGLGGVLAEAGLRAPFAFAAVVTALAGVYGLFFLPESLPPERRAPFRLAATPPWRALSILGRPGLGALTVVLVLTWLALQSHDNLEVLYTARRYGWDPLTFGLYVTVAAAVGLWVQGWLANRVARRIGEHGSLRLGLALQVVGLTAIGLAPTAAWYCLASVPAVLGGLARPVLQSLMSAATGPEEQGRLQGAVSAVGAASSIAGPLAFTQVFAWSVSDGRGPAWAGLSILLGAALTLLALAAVWRRPAVPS